MIGNKDSMVDKTDTSLGTERLSAFPKGTKLVSDKAMIQTKPLSGCKQYGLNQCLIYYLFQKQRLQQRKVWVIVARTENLPISQLC